MKLERVNLGEIIRQKVIDAGMSQAEFARRVGVARQNVNKTIFDKASIDVYLLCQISEVLDCNLFDYFRSNEKDDKTELKATITIEIGAEKKDRTVRFLFGENNIEI